MRRVLILVAILGIVTACDPEAPTAEGSIVVVAQAGPVCPVESDPPIRAARRVRWRARRSS